MIESVQTFFGQVIAVAGGVSTPIKLAWLVWLLWGAAQIFWYRRARVIATQLPTPRPKPAPAKAPAKAAPKQAKPMRAGGSEEFLAALGLDEPSDKKKAK